MRVFGIDPGSERTGYGCVETDGSHHRIVVCGAIAIDPADPNRVYVGTGEGETNQIFRAHGQVNLGPPLTPTAGSLT